MTTTTHYVGKLFHGGGIRFNNSPAHHPKKCVEKGKYNQVNDFFEKNKSNFCMLKTAKLDQNLNMTKRFFVPLKTMEHSRIYFGQNFDLSTESRTHSVVSLLPLFSPNEHPPSLPHSPSPNYQRREEKSPSRSIYRERRGNKVGKKTAKKSMVLSMKGDTRVPQYY